MSMNPTGAETFMSQDEALDDAEFAAIANLGPLPRLYAYQGHLIFGVCSGECNKHGV
jgi:hypothetical protein